MINPLRSPRVAAAVAEALRTTDAVQLRRRRGPGAAWRDWQEMAHAALVAAEAAAYPQTGEPRV